VADRQDQPLAGTNASEILQKRIDDEDAALNAAADKIRAGQATKSEARHQEQRAKAKGAKP
jgi:hypothetical protein